MYDPDLPVMMHNYDEYLPFQEYLHKYTTIDSMEYFGDREHRVMTLVDRNGSVVGRSRFASLASYVPSKRIWSWAWSWTPRHPEDNAIIKKLVLRVIDLGPHHHYLRQVVLQSAAMIADLEQVHINLAITMSLIKERYIYTEETVLEDGAVIYHYYALLDMANIQNAHLAFMNRTKRA